MNGQSVKKYMAPLAGGLQAVYTAATPAPPSRWRHSDWLGSSRLASTASQTVYYDGMYAPFGENYGEVGGGFASIDRSFTGQTQDMTLGLYDFTFRQQSPSQGRWLAPDPAGMAAVDMTNPQTWNRYAYVGNNPLNATDPLGLYLIQCRYDGDSNCDDDGLGAGDGSGGVGGPGPCWDCGGGQPPPGKPTPQPQPQPQPQPVNFPNETNGIPNGIQTGSWGILPALFPSNLSCPAELSSLCGGIDPGMGIGVIWPQLTPLQTQCLLSALRTNGVSLGLDIAGFIPFGGGLAHTVTQLGVGAASTVNSAMHGNVGGSLISIAGFHLTALEPLATAIPGIGTTLNAVGTGFDLKNVVKDYQTCMSGG
jgi:RHS repeat-associated protein